MATTASRPLLAESRTPSLRSNKLFLLALSVALTLSLVCVLFIFQAQFGSGDASTIAQGDEDSLGSYMIDPSFIIPTDFEMEFCTGVAIRGNEVWISWGDETSPIYRFQSSGELLGSMMAPSNGPIVKSHSMIFQDEFLWVVDQDNFSLKKYSVAPDMASLDELVEVVGTAGVPGCSSSPLQFASPTDMDFDSNDNLYVADGDSIAADGAATSKRVYKIGPAPERDVLWAAGSCEGGEQGDEPGEFKVAHSIAYDEVNHRVWVTDGQNDRLQAFDADTGAYLGQLGCVEKPKWVDIYNGYLVVNHQGMSFFGDDSDPYSIVFLELPGADVNSCVVVQEVKLDSNSIAHSMKADPSTGDILVALSTTDPQYLLKLTV